MWTFLSFLIALSVTFLTVRGMRPGLVQAGIVGKDVNKPEKPTIPEMGGLAIVLGLSAGLLFTLGLKTFIGIFKSINAIPMLMALLTTFIVATIGIIDDLIGVRQSLKAAIPLFASVPLMMIQAEQSHLGLPLLDVRVEFGIFYPLILVPLGVTGAANAVNMLAGFNGLELGMASAAFLSLGVIAYLLGEATSLLILVAGFGAVVATLYYNWYPASILIGDVGTFTIGAIIASSVIIGDFEFAGFIVIVPYFLDFLLKAISGFPSEQWWGDFSDGKLYPPDGGPAGLAQLVMRLFGGITEHGLVLTLIGLESVFGVIAILFYLY